MERIRYLERLFAYDRWANRHTLEALQRISNPPARARKFMAHIIGAERLWLARLEQSSEKVAVWPDLTPDLCASELRSLDERWRGVLGGLSPESLTRQVSYVNSKGEPWTSSVEDILLHVVMHSAYHRGQIASDLRAAGHEPPYSDYIHAVRQGLVTSS